MLGEAIFVTAKIAAQVATKNGLSALMKGKLPEVEGILDAPASTVGHYNQRISEAYNSDSSEDGPGQQINEFIEAASDTVSNCLEATGEFLSDAWEEVQESGVVEAVVDFLGDAL